MFPCNSSKHNPNIPLSQVILNKPLLSLTLNVTETILIILASQRRETRRKLAGVMVNGGETLRLISPGQTTTPASQIGHFTRR